MIIDPWGAVIGQASDENATIAVAEINLDFLHKTRQKLPVWSGTRGSIRDHETMFVFADRRPELYGDIFAAETKADIDDQDVYSFGPIPISSKQVFYRSRLSFAFVNHRPVLAGHVLVCPLRSTAVRMSDLNSSEVADLFTTVQKVQAAIETEFSADATTIAIQDGDAAGRSVNHLHVHLLPRKPSDFEGRTDQVYAELQRHDKPSETKKKPPRSAEEMEAEAARLRKFF